MATPYSYELALERLSELFANVKEKNQAKYALAILSFLRISQVGVSHSRKDLIASHPELPSNKIIEKIASQVDWHRRFLARLLERDYIKQHQDKSIILYTIHQDTAYEFFQDIAMDALMEDGRELKKLLWPSEYGGNDAPEPDSETEEEILENPEEDQGLNMIQDLTQQLTQIAEHLGGIYTGMQTLNTNLEATETRLNAKLEKFEALDQKLEGLVSKFEGQANVVLEALRDERRSQLKSIADRLGELLARQNSVLNQLGSGTRQTEKIQAEIEALKDKEG